jgi:iron complex transport system ATP-binding protein
MTAVLEARELALERKGRLLVDGVDLDLRPGLLTVVVGPNGAGKSSLLRLLAGDIHPSRGSVHFAGQTLAAIPPLQLAHGRVVMAQSSEVAFSLSVFEVARIGADGLGCGLSAADRAGIVRSALRRADVAHLAERPYQTLSGGERQRVQFARALAQLDVGRTVAQRQVLLLDEPVSNLDLRHQLDLFAALAELIAEGMAILVVLHDLQLAASVAQELVLMHQGRVQARGAPAQVLESEHLSTVFGIRSTSDRVPDFPWTRDCSQQVAQRQGIQGLGQVRS